MDQMNEAVEGGRGACRQSSTRWTPTTDQIRILKELYYNNGVRSPSAEQIQRISARLRQYGKIEGKNVFYWFQNHKARERQKKRFTSDLPTSSNMLPQSSFLNHNNYPITAPTPPTGLSCPSSSTGAGVFLVGQPQGSSYGYGPNIAMDKSYRDSSCHHGYNNYVEPYTSPCGFFDKRKLMMEEEEGEDEQMMMDGREIETLPLFPMHAEDMINKMNFNYYAGAGWYQSSTNNVNDAGSLELTLNSYCYNARS